MTSSDGHSFDDDESDDLSEVRRLRAEFDVAKAEFAVVIIGLCRTIGSVLAPVIVAAICTRIGYDTQTHCKRL